MNVQISLLDQTILTPGESAEEAFAHTVELAQLADRLGYHRFWVAEHHDSDHVVGSSPEVLIAYLLGKTKRIRVGSGGVMLQHYSPYKVAENFNVLAALASGRVDLGIGRAPGGLPFSTRALQQDIQTTRSLEDKLLELEQFIQNKVDENHPLAGLKASPISNVPAPIFLLGASPTSAQLAAKLGYPYVFAQFITTDEAVADEAFQTYRSNFQSKNGTCPYAMLAVPVVIAKTNEMASELVKDCKLYKIHLKSGRTITVSSEEHAKEYERQAEETFKIEVQEANVIYGSKEVVRDKLLAAKERYGVDEFIVHTPLPNAKDRIHSFTLLMEAYKETAVKAKYIKEKEVLQ